MANQTPDGQPLTLAKAIYGYAVNINKLDNVGTLLELIAHKHVSLGVEPGHYKIVGECLIEAIEKVLCADKTL